MSAQELHTHHVATPLYRSVSNWTQQETKMDLGLGLDWSSKTIGRNCCQIPKWCTSARLVSHMVQSQSCLFQKKGRKRLKWMPTRLLKEKMGCVWGRYCIQRWRCTTRYPGTVRGSQWLLKACVHIKGKVSERIPAMERVPKEPRKMSHDKVNFKCLPLIEASQWRPSPIPLPLLPPSYLVKELESQAEKSWQNNKASHILFTFSRWALIGQSWRKGEIINLNKIWSYDWKSRWLNWDYSAD